MINKKIIILGGVGDGEVVASIINDISKYECIDLIGFLNDGDLNKILDYPVFGGLNQWEQYNQDDIFFISALLKTKNSFSRSRLLDSLEIPIEKFYTAIHPTAVVSKDSSIGYGNLIGPHVAIMPNVKIGNHCSFRAGASVGHHCQINDYCYMGPNSTLSGRSELSNGVHVGPNACVLDSVKVKQHCVLGAGSVLQKDTLSFSVYFGMPARKIESISINLD